MKKSLLIFLLISGLSGRSLSQSFNWDWANCASGYYSMLGEGVDVATDNDENLYITGFFNQYIAFGPYIFNQYNGGSFLAKYDSAGTLLWAKGDSIHPHSGHSGAWAVCTDESGNCIITGGFMDTVYFNSIRLTSTSPGGSTFVVKYNSSGDVLWAYSSSRANITSTQDFGLGIATDTRGSIYITGTYSSTVVFGTDTLTTPTNDNYLVKMDQAGNVLWARSGHSNLNGSQGTAVATDPWGCSYVTGCFSGTSISFGNCSLSNTHPGTEDYFVVKYNSAGVPQWVIGSGSASNETGTDIACDVLGNVIATGTCGVPSSSFINKYDSSGNLIWSKYLSGTNTHCLIGCYRVTTDKDANIYATGGFFNSPIDIAGDTLLQQPPSPSDPLFIVEYNAWGHLQFVLGVNNGGDDNCGIAVTQSNKVYIGGDFTSTNFVLGNTILHYPGNGEDVFVAKLSILSTTGFVESEHDWKFNLYPNPFEKDLNIEINNDEETQVYINDLSGRTMIHQVFSTKTILRTDFLPEGAYYFVLENKQGEIHHGKIIKQ